MLALAAPTEAVALTPVTVNIYSARKNLVGHPIAPVASRPVAGAFAKPSTVTEPEVVLNAPVTETTVWLSAVTAPTLVVASTPDTDVSFGILATAVPTEPVPATPVSMLPTPVTVGFQLHLWSQDLLRCIYCTCYCSSGCGTCSPNL